MKRTMPVLSILCLVLLGAHFMRFSEPGLAAALAGLAGLVPTRRAFVRPVVFIGLAWACLVWSDSGIELVRLRMAMDAPYLRFALIIGAVVGLTLLCMALLLSNRGGEWFNRDADKGRTQAGLFILTFSGLFLARTMTPFPVLLLDRYLPGWGGLEIFLLALYAVCVGTLMLDPKTGRKVRPRIWALFSLVFFTQLGLGLLGVDKMLMTGKLHLPVPALIAAGPIYRGHSFFMPILFAASVLLVGPAWCGRLCYIGVWDDLASRMAGKKPDPKFPAHAIWFRLASLILVSGAALGLRLAGVATIYAVTAAALFGLAGVAVMLILSRRFGLMVHCTTFCPIGLVANILGKLSPWRMRMNSDCDKCGACSPSCRYLALTPKDIAAGKPGLSCTLCGDCVAACPRRAMTYRFPGLSPQTAARLFLILSISLHAIFLGTARI